jgi:hypothetical protein
MSIKLRFTTMADACRAVVSGTADSVCFAIQGEEAKAEYFGGVKDASVRASHLNTIRLLASKASKTQKEALQKAVLSSDASQYYDFVTLVKLACTKDATKPISTGKGATRQSTENVVAPTAVSIQKAVAAVEVLKANKKAADKAKRQPQAKSTKPTETPEAVESTNKRQALAALIVVQTASAVAEWDTKDKALPEAKKKALQSHIEAIADIVMHMTN